MHCIIYCFLLECETWKRDSHGLFDYESNDVVKNTLKINSTTNLFRNNDNIEQCASKYLNSRRAEIWLDLSIESIHNTIVDREDGEEMKYTTPWKVESNNKFLAEVNKSSEIERQYPDSLVHILNNKKGDYWIYHKSFYDKNEDYFGDTDKLLWITIRDYNDSASSLGYKLNAGDILRFGRAKVRVLKIQQDEGCSTESDYKIKISNKIEPPEYMSEDDYSDDWDKSESKVCRICFLEGFKDNQLISVCKWSGSMKYLHHQWLKEWMNSKRTIKVSPQCILYYWKTLECELCKTTYSEQLQSKYELAWFESPFPNYIALECINWNKSKTIHVLNLNGDKSKYRIGRGHDNDIRISDISVSRFHAFIVKENNGLVLKDNRSKFGTLVMVKKPMLLSCFSSIHLQIGRTLMQIFMKGKPEWSFTGCLCFTQKTPILEEQSVRYLSYSSMPDNCVPSEFKLSLRKEFQWDTMKLK